MSIKVYGNAIIYQVRLRLIGHNPIHDRGEEGGIQSLWSKSVFSGLFGPILAVVQNSEIFL